MRGEDDSSVLWATACRCPTSWPGEMARGGGVKIMRFFLPLLAGLVVRCFARRSMGDSQPPMCLSALEIEREIFVYNFLLDPYVILRFFQAFCFSFQ